MEREFDCIDCGVHVYSYTTHANDNLNVCAGCKWVREHPDAPEEMKRLVRGDHEPVAKE